MTRKKLITSLTSKQEDLMPVYARRWIDIGLSTERVDPARAEAAIHRIYDLTKHEKPKVIHVPSPLVGAIASVVIARILLDHAARSAAGVSAVVSAVGSAVGSAVDSAVDSAVVSAVDSAVGSAVRDGSRSAGMAYFGGNLWCWYASLSSYMREVLAVETEHGAAWEELCQSVCYWWALRGFALASDRPTELHRDDQGRLHNETGPSIAWSDGFALYHLHGVGVPSWIVTNPERITVATIDAEGNAEVRRLMTERFPGGVSEYLHQTGAKVVDFDQVEVVRGSGRMMPRALLRDRHSNQFLEGTDGSTDRSYFMSVDPNASTCKEAHESISGLDESRCVAQS